MTAERPGARQHRRVYDHRLREHVCRTGARALGHGLHVPRSTVATWKRRGLRSVVTLEALGQDPLLRQRKRLKAGQQPGKQPQLSKPAAVTKCVHGRDPVFCCDCRYLQ